MVENSHTRRIRINLTTSTRGVVSQDVTIEQWGDDFLEWGDVSEKAEQALEHLRKKYNTENGENNDNSN
jgi:hypothetical protein